MRVCTAARIPFAAFVAWFIFIGPGLAEFTHFLFPLITPAIDPQNPAAVTAAIHGMTIPDMANHHAALTGRGLGHGSPTA